ncbi:hypothetical protein Taro_032567 [Colocasia esculenta]|uniref:Peptidase A1 domain-containing protein n=1 Tax=Colocasia esculenta TaxID=4460 RepID=A0A843VLN7_COLES|nr:hypothetical protein [Colocasia esculenta]
MSPLLSHKNISALFSLLLLCCCNGQAVHDDGLGLQDVSVSSLKPTAVCSASEGGGGAVAGGGTPATRVLQEGGSPVWMSFPSWTIDFDILSMTARIVSVAQRFLNREKTEVATCLVEFWHDRAGRWRRERAAACPAGWASGLVGQSQGADGVLAFGQVREREIERATVAIGGLPEGKTVEWALGFWGSRNPPDNSLSVAGYGPNTVKIVHRYGPCSPFPNSKPDHHQILAQDALRVASLQAILSSASGGGNASASGEFRLVSLPAQRGIYLGTANYVVSQTVEIDTGSSVCWVQCKPCLQKQLCYPQEEPIFDPSASSTYRQIPCASAACRALHGAACGSSRQCGYRVVYGDKSYTIGSLAVDQLTLTPTNVFPNFVFGCGENNKGLFGKAAGLFGLARSPFSLVSQTASRLGNVFSYCLPTTSRATGHLTLGNSSVPTAAYTPMLTDRPLFYFINLIGISVGGVPLPVPPTVFQAGGTIIDSGTVITRLPPSAYSALRSAFSSRMSQYPRAQPSSLLDTCFDFTNLESITYPRITLHYSGVGVTLPFAGVFYVFDVSRICLAFAPNALPNDPNIIGNVQQVGFEVIYDIGAQRIGFAPGTCG